MNIRAKLVNSKQSSLAIAAILISLSIASSLIVLEWLKVNNEYETVLGGYVDKAAFEKCVEQTKQAKGSLGDPPVKWPKGSPQEALVKRINEAHIKMSCEKEWGLWKRVKKEPPSFHSFLLKEIADDDLEFGMPILAAGIYIIFSAYVYYARCAHLGWKRLAIVISFIPALIVVYFVLDARGTNNLSGEELFALIVWPIAGYIAGIWAILGGRRLTIWVKDGFNASK